MGSRRSRKAKARERFRDNLDEAFSKIRAEREGKSVRDESQPQNLAPTPKPKKNEKENPNHPCYKCIGCVHWTKCVGYSQLLECIERRRKGYEARLAENE